MLAEDPWADKKISVCPLLAQTQCWDSRVMKCLVLAEDPWAERYNSVFFVPGATPRRIPHAATPHSLTVSVGLNKTPYDILAFFWAPYFLDVLTPYDILAIFWPPSPLTFHNVKNDGNSEHERN